MEIISNKCSTGYGVLFQNKFKAQIKNKSNRKWKCDTSKSNKRDFYRIYILLQKKLWKNIKYWKIVKGKHFKLFRLWFVTILDPFFNRLLFEDIIGKINKNPEKKYFFQKFERKYFKTWQILISVSVDFPVWFLALENVILKPLNKWAQKGASNLFSLLLSGSWHYQNVRW